MGEMGFPPSASMDVYGRPHAVPDHGAALDVPAWPAWAPGALPLGFPLFGGLPQHKICSVALPAVHCHPIPCLVVVLQLRESVLFCVMVSHCFVPLPCKDHSTKKPGFICISQSRNLYSQQRKLAPETAAFVHPQAGEIKPKIQHLKMHDMIFFTHLPNKGEIGI